MSVGALSRLLEDVAQPIRHSVAMSTILATELCQARYDAIIDTSKLLLENSSYELQNAPINARLWFGNKIKEVAKSDYEAQQQRFLASSSTDASQQQKHLIRFSSHLKDQNCRTSSLDLSSCKCEGLKRRHSPLRLVLERT